MIPHGMLMDDPAWLEFLKSSGGGTITAGIFTSLVVVWNGILTRRKMKADRNESKGEHAVGQKKVEKVLAVTGDLVEAVNGKLASERQAGAQAATIEGLRDRLDDEQKRK